MHMNVGRRRHNNRQVMIQHDLKLSNSSSQEGLKNKGKNPQIEWFFRTEIL